LYFFSLKSYQAISAYDIQTATLTRLGFSNDPSIHKMFSLLTAMPSIYSRIQFERYDENGELGEIDRQPDNTWFTHPIVRGGR
jgi:hypothetical protein